MIPLIVERPISKRQTSKNKGWIEDRFWTKLIPIQQIQTKKVNTEESLESAGLEGSKKKIGVRTETRIKRGNVLKLRYRLISL